jgi:hypothetical protein
MVGVAVTLWVMFWLWVASLRTGLPPTIQRLAGGLLLAEVLALLIWSYGAAGCAGEECSSVVIAAGVAARVDIPLLCALLVALVVAQLYRAARRGATPGALRGRGAPAARPTGPGSPAGRPGSRRS